MPLVYCNYYLIKIEAVKLLLKLFKCFVEPIITCLVFTCINVCNFIITRKKKDNYDVIVSTMKGLAFLHKKLNKKSEALDVYREIVEIQKKISGENSPMYADTLVSN